MLVKTALWITFKQKIVKGVEQTLELGKYFVERASKVYNLKKLVSISYCWESKVKNILLF